MPDAQPFIRQAGGKRQLLPEIAKHIPPSSEWDTYVEPFLGGGAVFFYLWRQTLLDGKRTYLGDADRDLFKLWYEVQQASGDLTIDTNRMIGHQLRSGKAEAYYLEQRGLWNINSRTPARHLFLRRACFNGLWRENKQGHMNVPWKQEPAKVLGSELYAAAAALRDGVEMLDWDFRAYEGSHVDIGPKTLVYLDPPYLPEKKTGFTKYRAEGWSPEDLAQLLMLCNTWHLKGATVVLSHANTPEFLTLQAVIWPAAKVHHVLARRAINSDGKKRGPVGEVIVVGGPR